MLIAGAAMGWPPAAHGQQGCGLISYGPDTIDPFRRAADYVDRILKGAKPAETPVQAKYETVINPKTAKALGLELPATLLARVRTAAIRASTSKSTRRKRASVF